MGGINLLDGWLGVGGGRGSGGFEVLRQAPTGRG